MSPRVTSVSVLLDSIPPRMQGRLASLPKNKSYITNEELSFRLRFDDQVWVDTTNGTPALTLTVGTSIRHATYARGSGTSVLTFIYIAQRGDRDSDGISMSSASFRLNGGTIRDSAGNDATIASLVPPPLSGVTVNSIPPKLITVEALPPTGRKPSFGIGRIVTLRATFSEEVRITGSPELVLRAGEPRPQPAIPELLAMPSAPTLFPMWWESMPATPRAFGSPISMGTRGS